MVTDYFAYTAAAAQLRSCKYNKDIEQLARKYREDYHQLVHRLPVVVSQQAYEHYKYAYKLLALAISLYAVKSKAKFPNAIYDTHTYAQQRMVKGLSDDKNLFAPLRDCAEFIDMFEFDTVVVAREYGGDGIASLHNVIKDTSLSFKFKFSVVLSSFDVHSTANLDQPLRLHLYALRLKQTLSPDTPSTVLDQYVSDTFQEIKRHQDIAEQITLLQQHTSALQEYQNGQLQRLSEQFNREPV